MPAVASKKRSSPLVIAHRCVQDLVPRLRTATATEHVHFPESIQELVSRVRDLLPTLSDGAREEFLRELGKHFGGLRIFTESGEVAPDSFTTRHWKYGAYPVDACYVLPLTSFKVVSGETAAYQFRAISESSESDTVERYSQVEISGGFELSVKFLKLGASMKGGIKGSHQESVKSAEQNVCQWTRTFRRQRLVRHVLIWWSMGFNPQQEFGTRIQCVDGGDDVGPFWPDYSHSGPTKGDVEGRSRSALDKLLTTAATELTGQKAIGFQA